MSQQKIVDYKILQVLTKKYRQPDQQQKTKQSTYKANAPMKSIQLVPPQQPEDNIQNDLTIAPEEFKQFYDSVPISNSGERDQSQNLFAKNSLEFSSYNNQQCKRINTEVQNNDISSYLVSSIKYFKWEKSNPPKGDLVHKLLSEKKKGIKFITSFKSLIQFDSECYFVLIKCITNISILFTNCLFSILQTNYIFTVIQLIQFLALLIIILNLLSVVKGNQSQVQKRIKKEILPIILYFTSAIFQIILMIFSKLNSVYQDQTIILILQNIATTALLYTLELTIQPEKVIKLVIITFSQFHLFSCIFILIETKKNYYELQGEQQFLFYLKYFKQFAGYSFGLGDQSTDYEKNIEQYLYVLWSWGVFCILRSLFYVELYLLASALKENTQNQKQISQVLKYFKTLNFNKKQINKIASQIEMQQQQKKKIKEFQVQEQLLNYHFSIKEELLQKKQQLEIQSYFKNIKFLSQLSDLSQNQLKCAIETQFFKNNEFIITQNQMDDCSMYIIKSGIVEVCFQNQKNRKQKLKILENSDYFGQVSFLTGLARCATIISQGDSCIYKLNRKDFFEIINKNDNDRELINKMQYEIMYQNQYGLLDLKCYNCQSISHLVQFCPQLHLNTQKEKIIFNLLVHQEQRRHQYQRRKYHKENCKFYLSEYQAKCLEFQEDQGLASSLGDTDHTNYLQNQSHYTVTQSSINYPSKILTSQKLQMKSSALDNVQNLEHQESLKEQQFKEIDQIFVRTAQQKATTSTAGFGYKESSSLKSKNYENVNDTIDEQGSEESSEMNSQFSDDQISGASMRLQQKPMRQSTQRSDKHSQHRSRVSSISMNYTPKHSQISLQNTFTLKSDLNNNIVQSGSNQSSQKNISPIHLRENEKQNTLTVPGSGNNVTKNPSKRSMLNPISQLNYENSPFVAFNQNILFVQADWNNIEIDKQAMFTIYFPEFNVNEVITSYNIWMKKQEERANQLRLENMMNKIQKFNTL